MDARRMRYPRYRLLKISQLTLERVVLPLILLAGYWHNDCGCMDLRRSKVVWSGDNLNELFRREMHLPLDWMLGELMPGGYSLELEEWDNGRWRVCHELDGNDCRTGANHPHSARAA